MENIIPYLKGSALGGLPRVLTKVFRRTLYYEMKRIALTIATKVKKEKKLEKRTTDE